MPALDRRRRAAALALAAAACLLVGAPARPAAQPLHERAPRKVKTVGVAAFRNCVVGAEDLFREEGAELPYDAALRGALAYVQERLALERDIALVRDRDLRDRITARQAYREGILLAREWFNLGVDHYRALRLDRALENFERAEAVYLEVFQDLVEPATLAALELYRGLALGEAGDSGLGHAAFRRMFAYDPWQRFPRGYYPAATERALDGALVDFRRTAGRDLLLLPPERLDRFLGQQGLDTLVFAWLEPTADGDGGGGPAAARTGAPPPRLHLVVYERAPGRVAFRDSAPLSGGPEDRDAVDRLVARWLACAAWEHREQPKEARAADFFVDAGVAYTIIVDQPPREYSHDFGFHASFAYQLSRSFDLHATLGVQATFPDRNKDLVRSSTHVRVVVGAGFTFLGRHLRFYVHPGLVYHYLGDFVWTTNVDCKFFGVLDDEDLRHGCEDGLQSLATDYFIGFDLATGLNVFVTQDIYLDVRVDGEAWVIPYDPTGVISFPISFALAMGYAF